MWHNVCVLLLIFSHSQVCRRKLQNTKERERAAGGPGKFVLQRKCVFLSYGAGNMENLMVSADWFQISLILYQLADHNDFQDCELWLNVFCFHLTSRLPTCSQSHGRREDIAFEHSILTECDKSLHRGQYSFITGSTLTVNSFPAGNL